jgi:hypothetical protein
MCKSIEKEQMRQRFPGISCHNLSIHKLDSYLLIGIRKELLTAFTTYPSDYKLDSNDLNRVFIQRPQLFRPQAGQLPFDRYRY